MTAVIWEDHFKTKLEEDACSFFAISEQRRKYGECIIVVGIARGTIIFFRTVAEETIYTVIARAVVHTRVAVTFVNILIS